jgi:RNA polymerase sigma factor (sigma-70 family)
VEKSLDDATDGPALELAAPGPRADDVAHARRVGATLESELAALPDRQREALWLAAVEGFSYAEVARALETSEPSVKALVHRARATLVERMGPEGMES